MVPARSSRHGLSCSRHLSRSQAEIPLVLAAQIPEPALSARPKTAMPSSSSVPFPARKMHRKTLTKTGPV
ncbi:hypothetical protein F4V90_30855 [Neorhizobium galegae]|nr:hypothetical protein F4V90_30855 [Neorhizobium galegae]